MNGKAPDAFRTISEVAEWLGVNAHVLRFWESKFSQVKPVKRAGGRRYYRPSDMELLGGIQKLLHEDGMTIKGVQKVLREKGIRAVCAMSRPVDDLAPAAAPKVEAQSEGAPADAVAGGSHDADAAPSETADIVETAADGTPPEADVPQPEAEADESFPDPVADAAAEPLAQPLHVQSGDGDAGDRAINGAAPEEKTPAPGDAGPEGDGATMPLFSHRQQDAARPDRPEAGDAADAHLADTGADTAMPHGDVAAAADHQPIVAPLPRSDIGLGEALATLSPGMIDAARLRPIHARLVALRARMGEQG